MGYAWAILVLQFHLLRHTLTQGKLLAYFAVGIIACCAIVFAGALGWGFFFLGSQWLPGQPRPMVLLTFNGILLLFFIAWFWGLVMEVQRADVIDIRKMIYFPVPLSIVNAINYLVSLLGLTSLFYVAAVSGLLCALARLRGEGVFLAMLAAGAFFFLYTSWAYYIRGLLVVWMEDKRRRRMLMTLLPFVFMTVGFTPMMLSNLAIGEGRHDAIAEWLTLPEQLVWLEKSSFFHPGGLLSLALTSMYMGNGPFWRPVILLFLVGALGYYLGYRTSVRYGYGNQSATAANISPRQGNRPPWTARKLPLIHEETAALAQALLLNFVRHPQVRTMLLAPIGLIVLLAVADSRAIAFGQQMGLPVVAMLWPFFMFSGLFFNLFGMDQRGFRTVMLLPAPRSRVIMAYHLALLPLAGGMGLAFALFGSWYFSLDFETTLVSVLQIGQLFLNFSIAGTFVSIYAPMTIGRNMMRRQQSRVLLVSLLMPFVVAFLVLPTAFCLFVDSVASGWGLIAFPVAPVMSVVLLGLTLAVYPLVLRHAGDLLMAREQRILAQLLKSAS